MSNALASILGFSRGRNNKQDGFGEGGFTLVELLVVIAIISILATLLLLQLGVARARARDAKRIADINQTRSAIELYFDQNGSYPGAVSGNIDMAILAPTYLLNVPKDPLATPCTTVFDGSVHGAAQCYGYAYATAGAASATPIQYQVWAELENNNRNALSSDADINSTGWGGATVNGASEACTAAASDCVFDLGSK